MISAVKEVVMQSISSLVNICAHLFHPAASLHLAVYSLPSLVGNNYVSKLCTTKRQRKQKKTDTHPFGDIQIRDNRFVKRRTTTKENIKVPALRVHARHVDWPFALDNFLDVTVERVHVDFDAVRWSRDGVTCLDRENFCSSLTPRKFYDIVPLFEDIAADDLKWQEQEDNIIISQILKEVMVCLSLPIVLLSIAINN